MPGPYTVALDIGSSSVRALLFDRDARQMEGFGAQLPYRVRTTPDGGAEVDPNELADLSLDCLDEMHRQVLANGLEVSAIGGSAFWHSFLGVDRTGKPTFPILHLLDTRAEPYAHRVPNTHARTGCLPHASYWPAKLLWLAEHRATELAATARFLSFPEYLFLQIFGRPTTSLSMISATGLWNQNAGDYDAETLAALPIRREQLADPAAFDQPETELRAQFATDWPCFANAKWFPALGDGACNNLGSGCLTRQQASLMVGTTGAMRVIVEAPSIEIPPGLWCYRVDRKRFVLGGALSNGGEVYAWAKRTLQLPKDLEARLETATPGAHGLTALPFFSGERTPYWRGDLRAAITGMSASTEPFDILCALLEGVALGFSEIHQLLESQPSTAKEVIASGNALLKSPGWTQMMADALDRPVTACVEPEPSCRGAALWAMEQAGIMGSIAELPASTGGMFHPIPARRDAFRRLREQRHALYERLYQR